MNALAQCKNTMAHVITDVLTENFSDNFNLITIGFVVVNEDGKYLVGNEPDSGNHLLVFQSYIDGESYESGAFMHVTLDRIRKDRINYLFGDNLNVEFVSYKFELCATEGSQHKTYVFKLICSDEQTNLGTFMNLEDMEVDKLDPISKSYISSKLNK